MPAITVGIVDSCVIATETQAGVLNGRGASRAPRDDVASAITLKVSLSGNVRGETLRTFAADEVTGILGQLN
jgi:hypothetical protein